MQTFIDSLLNITTEMSWYLLLGFFVAGLLHVFVKKKYFNKYVSGNNTRSVVAATLLGIPLPLCSCGVIPTAVSLKRKGASDGATTAFLTATPQTGVDSIAATYSLLGGPFAFLRPLAALVIGVGSGVMVNIFGKHTKGTSSETAHDSAEDEEFAHLSFWGKMKAAFRYGFVDMLQDVGKWLLIGLIVAAAITALVPDSYFELLSQYPMLNLFVVLLFSVPMYLCATGSIPIALSLMLKGLSPGAAFVLLMAGPATNMASIFVVSKVLGKRNTAIYLFSIIAGAIGIGFFIDALLPAHWFNLKEMLLPAAHCHESISWFNLVGTALLLGLIVYAFYAKLHKPTTNHLNNSTDMSKVYKIKGMNCNHCKMSVEKNLSKLPGVTTVTVDLSQGEAHVEGEPSDEEVRKLISELGFECI